MARNGSGTYSKVNTFVSGNSITAAGHNQNWDDLVAEMTNSVAADGQTTMTGPLKAASGTVAAPGIAFAAELDTGLFRLGTDSIGVAAGGTKILHIDTSGMQVTGGLTSTLSISAPLIQQAGNVLIPVGFGPCPWSGTTAPAGWVLAGATYSRTTYAALWAFAQTEIAGGNTFYGVGDGSTTFTIATMDGYAPVGTDTSAARIASFTNVGATAGAATVALTQANLPSATLTTTITDPGHAHTVAISAQQLNPGAGSGTFTAGGSSSTSNATTGITASTALGGSNTAHANVQPSRAFKFIVFTGV